MYKIQEVSSVNLSLGCGALGLMPAYHDLPEEFRKNSHPLVAFVARWFFCGLPEGTKFVPRQGVDTKNALRHIRAILCSFEPKHEHKEAGCAYLLDQWLERVDIPGGQAA